MLHWLKRLVGKQTCFICKNKAAEPQYYIDDAGNSVAVCFKCVPYAERRALRKAK